MSNPTIAIVGSGPIGSTYARVLLERVPDARVVMFEAGPQLTDLPGESVRNIADPGEKARAREMSQGPQAGAFRESLGIPAHHQLPVAVGSQRWPTPSYDASWERPARS
jgi:hypothetical protein